MGVSRLALCFALAVAAGGDGVSAQATPLFDRVSVIEVQVGANDAVYDPVRGRIYATIGDDGPQSTANTISWFDSTTLALVGSVAVGLEPNQIAIADDASMVYAGIDGERALRSFRPATGAIGPLVPIRAPRDEPAIVEDLAVRPGSPNTVVVSKDKVGTTASGALGVIRDDVEVGRGLGAAPNANSIAFSDANTLIAYNNSSTAFDLASWSFD
ncbi:MAG: hypothetical protein AAFS11_08765, partial [Planctomycetota bacterium]